MVIILVKLNPMKFQFDKYRDIINEICFFFAYFATMKYNNKFWFFTDEYNITLFIIIMNSIILLTEVIGSLIEVIKSIKSLLIGFFKKDNKI